MLDILCVILAVWAADVAANRLHYAGSANGFTSSAKGWNGFGLDKVEQVKQTAESVIEQCDAMHQYLGAQGYQYCSIDSGWAADGCYGDEYARFRKSDDWDIPAMASHMHDNGMLLGIYLVTGFFGDDKDKTILGTDIKMSEIEKLNETGGHYQENCRWAIDYSKPGAQAWCNSNVDLFAEWGVDFIKLDYVTPGSVGACNSDDCNPDPDSSGVVGCFWKAIQQSGRQMRLDISWKLEYEDERYDNIWHAYADSLRLDQDINGQSAGAQTNYKGVQRTIEMYRRYMVTESSRYSAIRAYPDLDNLFVGNGKSKSGLTDDQRRITYSHWIGSGANLILGSDMTKLDDLGLYMLQSDQFNWIADNFANTWPMIPTVGNDNLDQGSRFQTWVGGPDDSGNALFVIVDYGDDTDLDFEYTSDDGSGDWSFGSDVLVDNGLDASCYSAQNLWNPSNNGDLEAFSSFSVKLSNEKVLMLLLSPNTEATDCGYAIAKW